MNAGCTHPRIGEWIIGYEHLRERIVREHEIAVDTPVTWSIQHEEYCPRRNSPLVFELPCTCLPKVALYYEHITDPDAQPPIKALTGAQLADYGKAVGQ